MIKIEKGIGIPKSRMTQNPICEDLQKLQPGDSFVLDMEENTSVVYQKLYRQIRYHFLKLGYGMAACKVRINNEVKIRFWRTY